MCKFKPGDTVRVKPLEWFEQNCIKSNGCYHLKGNKGLSFFTTFLCGKPVKIYGIRNTVNAQYYITDSDVFQDWMLEDTTIQ